MGCEKLSFLEKKVGPFSMFQFIGIVGAVLVVLSFFLTWGSTKIMMFEEINHSGMDFFNKEMWSEASSFYDAWQNYIPLVTLVLAVVALIISIVPGENLGGVKTEKILGIVSIVIAVVLLVITVLFMTWFGGIDLLGVTYNLGTGAYICLVGSILVFIVGILPLFKKMTA